VYVYTVNCKGGAWRFQCARRRDAAEVELRLELDPWPGGSDSGGARGRDYVPCAEQTGIQLATLVTAGGTRGAGSNEVDTLQGMWKESEVQNFSDTSELQAWEENWPHSYGPAAKIIYDPAAAEIRVIGRRDGRAFKRIFPIDKDLATTLQQVNTFVSRTAQKIGCVSEQDADRGKATP